MRMDRHDTVIGATRRAQNETMTPLALPLLFALMLSAPPPAQAPAPAPPAAETPPPAVTLPPALDRVLRDYEAAWRDGDGARLSALFTEDGFAIRGGRPIARGRAAIAAGVTSPGGSLQLVAYAYATSGDVGHIVGGYRYPQSRGAPGRFVLALRRGADGRWLIAADLDNNGPR
jgi:ketosteroid isomerase-like protein